MTFMCEGETLRPSVVPGALHRLDALPETIHWGYFDAARAPSLIISSGDLIQAEAVTHHAGDDPHLMMDDKLWQIWNRTPESDRTPGVHIMTGPIYIRDAKPGDMLEVRYLSMQPRFRHGSNLAAHWGQLYQEFDETERVTIYQLDADTNTAQAAYAYDVADKYLTPGRITYCPECDRRMALQGVRVPVRPHLGTAGVAPDITGRVSTVPPGLHGGNIDNWRIGAGATMYYRVQVEGGLFSIGDPHISQGDGEISGTAIEASLNVLFQIILRKDFSFPSPLLETPKNWIVHGFGDTLNAAMKNASLDMLDLLGEKGLSRNDAYSLMSVASDFTVTQVVDGTQGVHVRMPRNIFPSGARKTD
ncbi:formamidase [Komagataeibacter rhaeticus]|uniref:acetamidase/formamidase family protein n=1 Tax=Komagataeibacter rhaeticus TaxID=215221 RepID=UPI0004D613B6|nr:acetamidase/formamidase family protein [Komagataeibacter rhaeticus]KDU96356.1 formamidase [Komagataeibacter rhaeticus AF1]MBL7240040.1 acetamidase/formamidase family protein [Komagataeibacter rhaeticus]PYD54789.1 formamidase [Komagataeibacter rhaeticus]GBQ18556.1 putative acetamidase [Komagataeibacter rhaeticus DSM 16663]